MNIKRQQAEEEEGKRKEAKELLKEGYIDLNLWQQLLKRNKVYLEGEKYKCHQALKEIGAKLEYLKQLKYSELPDKS